MNKAILTTSGLVLSALLASLCCIGPVVFSLIGAGSLGFAAAFEPYRPYLMAMTVVFLGAGFYFTYRKRAVGCEDGACKVESASTLTRSSCGLLLPSLWCSCFSRNFLPYYKHKLSLRRRN